MLNKEKLSLSSLFTILITLQTAIYISSNVLAVKFLQINNIPLVDAGTFLFPFAYVIGDIITEIYGYNKAKKAIILVFCCNIIFILSTSFGLLITSSNTDINNAYSMIFSFTPRILIASAIAYFSGEILNAKIMYKMKIKNKKQALWKRTILSSVFGEFCDTVLFILIAYSGIIDINKILILITTEFSIKIIIEIIIGTPLDYLLINSLYKNHPEIYSAIQDEN